MAEAASEILVQQGIPVAFLGVYLAMACVVPFGFYTANYCLQRRSGERITYIEIQWYVNYTGYFNSIALLF